MTAKAKRVGMTIEETPNQLLKTRRPKTLMTHSRIFNRGEKDSEQASENRCTP